MAEFSGSSIEITTLLQFLSGLGKTGDLVVHREGWQGLMSLENGKLIGAAVGNEHGLDALEFICIALCNGSFEFFDRPPSLSPDLRNLSDAAAELERLASAATEFRSRSWLPGPTAIPRLLDSSEDRGGDGALGLSRGAVYVLLDVDGQRTVRELAEKHGHLRTVESITRLRDAGLITFDEGSQTIPASIATAANSGASATMRPAVALSWSPRELWQQYGARIAAAALGSEILRAVVFTGLLIVGLRAVVQNFRVEGVSMLPAFQGGQALVVNRAAYYHVEQTPLAAILPTTSEGSTQYLFGGPRRGDVAVFHAPTQPNTDYIKRIVGLPGDTVLIQNGILTINGEQVDEPYIKFSAHYVFPEDGRPLVVPDGHYFVLGDNRPESFDSHFGWLVPVENLVGRVWLRYWPLNQVGVVEPEPPALARAPSQPVGQAGR